MADEGEVVNEVPETTSRDDVAAAFDQHDAAAVAEAPPKAAPPDGQPAAPAEGSTGRDAAGRFAPRSTGKAAPHAAGPAQGELPLEVTSAVKPGTAAESAQVSRHVKAPASWTAGEATHWDKISAEAREAVMRREVEVSRALQETASARQGLNALQQVIAPYMPNIAAANGGDVVGSIKTFFDYDNRLRHGTQIEKSKAVAALIRGYGIDIATLDTELAGQAHDPSQVNQSAIATALARELAPMREYLARQQQVEETRFAQTAEQVDAGIRAFAVDPVHKHYDAVRGDMADLIEIASNQGRKMTLQDAYERACWQNPQVRATLIAEQAATGTTAQTQAAQRARAAAVGVKNAPRAGAPAAAPPPDKRARADDIRAAFASHAGEE